MKPTTRPVVDHPVAHRAPAMGAATFAGAAVVSLPYAFLGRNPATVVAAALSVVVLVVIAEVRHRVVVAGLATVSLFGAFDGLTSEVAVLAGQLTRHTSGTKSIAVVGVALAAGSAVSMALGEWLGDNFGVARWVAVVQTFATAAAAIAAGVVVAVAFGAGG